MKKGFTFVELLAVIIILVVIALITTPIIVNIIETSRKGTATTSTLGYIRAVEKYYLDNLGSNKALETGTDLEVTGLNGKFKTTGQLPTDGTLRIDEDGLVEKATLCVGNYYISYDGADAVIEKGKTCQDLKQS